MKEQKSFIDLINNHIMFGKICNIDKSLLISQY